jgi:hypothetical protein
MEIRPASLAQISKGRSGQLVAIDDDVQGVANALFEIDPHIRLRYSEAGEYFVVYYKPDEWEEGDGYMIFTARDLDHRIVQKMREVHARCLNPGYSLAAEMEKAEAEAKRQADHQWSEEHGEMHERLAHALREQAGYDKQRIFVPEGIG